MGVGRHRDPAVPLSEALVGGDDLDSQPAASYNPPAKSECHGSRGPEHGQW